MVDAVDADGRWLYRMGGISALVLGVAYIVTIPLYAHVGPPPSGGEAWLKYVAGRTTEWWAILGLSVSTDLLFIPIALSLYLALRGVNREAMLVATAFVGLFVVLSSGILMIGLVMLKGVFSRATAYLALVTGILGIVSITGWNVTIIMNAIVATVWVLFVGCRLYRLGQQ